MSRCTGWRAAPRSSWCGLGTPTGPSRTVWRETYATSGVPRLPSAPRPGAPRLVRGKGGPAGCTTRQRLSHRRQMETSQSPALYTPRHGVIRHHRFWWLCLFLYGLIEHWIKYNRSLMFFISKKWLKFQKSYTCLKMV